MTKQLNPEAAFLAYVRAAEALGTERGACAAVAKEFDVPRSTITRLAARYRFSQRYRGEVQPIARAKTNETAATSAAEWRAEQARVGAELVRRSMEALQTMPIASVRDALSALKLGQDMATQATQPAQKQVNVDVRHILTERFQKLVEGRPALPAPRPQVTVDFGDLDDDLPAEGDDA